ncbi:hypothetical protein CU102_04700 [Phyllobacterium brassicacearum]|uniref:Uncharacterized protein n=1 Tax=Phyllobacterium brassicacearum TaxID=314235 RepID=A0A2P7BVD1_9HYPH|nr:hypothetical protein CU102_04700 [Phyllobacterium brassicacearum]TDQ28038.1 hypothetical protein DEV91_11191 [Phyllobacterium brassicacearum]
MQQSALKRHAFQAQSDRRIIKQMHQIGLIRRQGEYTIYLDPICAEYQPYGGKHSDLSRSSRPNGFRPLVVREDQS